MAIRVGVLGAGGRMGQTVCEAVAADPGLDLVGGSDPAHVGEPLAVGPSAGSDAPALTVDATPDALAERGADVVVDFTHLEAARANLRWAAAAGIHAVAGTTGWTEADYDALRQAFTTSNCLIAPNFAIGAVLMMRFARLAAPWFETAEVIELHHDQKLDAPSGTAMRTVEGMAVASSDWGSDPTRTETVPGARGAAGPAGIHIHSVRLHGLVAHHEVLLGTTGQSLTIRHDSYDRTGFMPGVLLAVTQIAHHPGLTVGLDPLLGLG